MLVSYFRLVQIMETQEVGPSLWSEQTCAYIWGDIGLDRESIGPQLRCSSRLLSGSQAHEQLDWSE